MRRSLDLPKCLASKWKLVSEMSAKSIIIAGGGLTGALAALMLARDGHRVSLYERRGDIRDAKIVHGRSINLAISTRGLTALERVGLRQEVLDMAVPMRGRRMHGKDNSTTFQPYSANEDENICEPGGSQRRTKLCENCHTATPSSRAGHRFSKVSELRCL